MSKLLSSAQVNQYRNEGYTFPVSVFSAEEVTYFKSSFEKVRAHIGEDATPHDIRQPQIHFKWAYEIATHPKVLDAIEDLVGSNILVCRGSIFFKDPGPGYYTFHQDAYNLGLSKEHAFKFVTAWIALTESNLENGCMQVVPRSHLTELPHAETLFETGHNKNSAVSRGLTVEREIDEAEKVSFILKPGQMSLHHAHLIHGSGPNRTNATRIGVVMRYASPDVKEKKKLNHPVIVARGVDTHGYNDHLEKIPSDSLEEGLKAASAYIAGHPEGQIYKKQSSLLSGKSN